MKKLLYTFIAIILSICIYAQSPQGFSYQAVVRDNGGLVIPNQSVGVLISILQGSSTGTLIYSETFTETTNDFGLMTLNVGTGGNQVGDFTTIAWSADIYFIQVDIDVTGGTTYLTMGTSQLMSVPYALHAKTVEVDLVDDADADPANELQDWSNLPGIPANIDIDVTDDFDGNYSSLTGAPTNVSTFTNDAGYITDPDDADADPSNELQNWSNLPGIPVNIDTDVTDDFDGNYSSLTGAPTNVSTFTNDAGYITDPDDADADPSNELQNWSNLPGIPINIDTDATDDFDGNYTSLSGTPTNVSAFINDAGYITAGVAGWELDGNAGTIVGTDFIGTTDNKDLDIRTNNTIKWRYKTKGTLEFLNTGNSVFIGEGAGAADNLTDNKNTFIGTQSGTSTSIGDQNTACGYNSLNSNVTGSYNTAMGSGALASNTTSYNTAVGYMNLTSNTVGLGNTAMGNQVLFTNIGGQQNVGIGTAALHLNDNGSYNAAIGTNSLQKNVDGNNNIAIGQKAMFNNTDGFNNTAVGAFAYENGTSYSNSSAFGYLAPITASNQISIGNTNVTSIRGQVSWGTYSDKRFKKDIKETVPGLDFILKLRPVTYHPDMNYIAEFLKIPQDLRDMESEKAKGSMLQTGFIAQEVEKAASDLGFEFSGVDKPKNKNDFYGLRYAEFTVPLVKATQEQQAIIEQQQKEIDELKEQLQEQKQLIEEIQQSIDNK